MPCCRPSGCPGWCRQEKTEVPAIDWFTDAVRNKTVYVSQGRLEIK
jgi:hypothetical protein